MAINITGLENNGYLVNNDILINIDSTASVVYYKLSFLIDSISKYGEIMVTPINNIAKLNISGYLKALFPVLNQDNQNIHVEIKVTSYERIWNESIVEKETTSITKSFIRGGKRGNYRNIYLQSNTRLSPVQTIPFWSGFEFKIQTLTELSGKINITNEILPVTGQYLNTVRRKVRGCDNTYIKFLNSLGGYSYWLFEGLTNSDKNDHGEIINNTYEIDLGNTYENEKELYSKVPTQYIAILQDLIISPEIYMQVENDNEFSWQRVYSSSNTIESNTKKAAHDVKIKIKPFNNFNPQITWH